MELKKGKVYGMTVKAKPTFAPGWSKLGPTEHTVKVKVGSVKIMDNGDQYFTYIPVGFSQGLCGFGAHRLSHVKMVELG